MDLKKGTRKTFRIPSYNKGNIRLKYLNDLRIKLSLIDYIFTEIKECRAVKYKTLHVAISKLATIKNIIYGWTLNEEKGKMNSLTFTLD